MKVSVQFGSGNVWTHDGWAPGTTVGQVLRDQRAQAALGFGSNVSGELMSVPAADNTPLYDGAVVRVVNKECKKAV